MLNAGYYTMILATAYPRGILHPAATNGFGVDHRTPLDPGFAEDPPVLLKLW